MVNYRLIAIQIGDLLKYATTINDINRAAESVFNFSIDHFPNESITSERAQLFQDWVLTLARQNMKDDDRDDKLIKFIYLITPPDLKEQVDRTLSEAGVSFLTENKNEFFSRNFHPEIHKHCSKLFFEGNYFHAVFEATKIYNKSVRLKSNSDKDGKSLMMDVWSPTGVLKVTACETDTDINFQQGIQFLSAGLLQAIRNPTSHEPAIHWPISKTDCLDLLSFISYLFRQLDKAIYYYPKINDGV